MRLTALVVAAGLLWSVSAFSQQQPVTTFYSGNDLYAKCTAPAHSLDTLLCGGMVGGLADAFIRDGTMCLPKGVNIGQAVDVVVAYLRAHPETRRYTMASEAAQALGHAFPCATPSSRASGENAERGPSGTAAPFEATLMGAGSTSCGDFADHYRSDADFTGVLFFTWAQGYMSGLNVGPLSTTDNSANLNSIPAEQQQQALRTYCNDHPLARYFEAVRDLYGHLKPIGKAP
jgi:hypothetical protein